MTLDEMKLAVCEKLPDVLEFCPEVSPCDDYPLGQDSFWVWADYGTELHWPTDGLTVCHEAEKLLYPSICGRSKPWQQYCERLDSFCLSGQNRSATYEQRLEALCRVWWPERFKQCCCPPTGNDEACPVCVRDAPEWSRACGDCRCDACGALYYDHPKHEEHPWLVVLCSGKLVKL